MLSRFTRKRNIRNSSEDGKGGAIVEEGSCRAKEDLTLYEISEIVSVDRARGTRHLHPVLQVEGHCFSCVTECYVRDLRGEAANHPERL